MYNQRNITHYHTDDFDRKMLDRSYCVLINPNFSVERKLTAVEFLSRFSNIKEHRERLEILLEKETNPRVRTHLKKALNGSLFDYITNAFKDFESIDQSIEREYHQELNKDNKLVSSNISANIPFLRYQSKLISE